MHRYCPATFPEDYQVSQFESEWEKTYFGEIPFTLLEADRQIGRLLRFVDRNPDFALLLASSMGQATEPGSPPSKSPPPSSKTTAFPAPDTCINPPSPDWN